MKRVFRYKIRQEARSCFYRKISAISEVMPKFDDDKFANSGEEEEDTEEDFDEELEEEYA